MREYRLALATAASALALIVIGGLVHATGSSLACPDWPLCGGELLAPMTGGALYEQLHRLAAVAVAVLTVALAALVVTRREDRGARRLAVAAVTLVAAEAALGAVAVVLDLPLAAAVGHLALSMGFLAAIVALAWRLSPAAALPGPGRPRTLAGVAAAGALGSVVLGGIVRHTGAALACAGPVLCGGSLWPEGGPARLQMAHRLWNWALAVAVAAAAVRTLRDRAAPPAARVLAALAPVLLVLQGLLGIATVGTAVSVPVVSLHVAVAALVVADLVALHAALGRRGASVRSPAPSRAIAPAHP